MSNIWGWILGCCGGRKKDQKTEEVINAEIANNTYNVNSTLSSGNTGSLKNYANQRIERLKSKYINKNNNKDEYEKVGGCSDNDANMPLRLLSDWYYKKTKEQTLKNYIEREKKLYNEEKRIEILEKKFQHQQKQEAEKLIIAEITKYNRQINTDDLDLILSTIKNHLKESKDDYVYDHTETLENYVTLQINALKILNDEDEYEKVGGFRLNDEDDDNISEYFSFNDEYEYKISDCLKPTDEYE